MLIGNLKREGNGPFLNQKKIEFRKYQKDIAKKCINNNSLVVLPTGLGKTIIAVLVSAYTLEIYPPESKILVMAPTRPLINQHYDTFLKFLNLKEEKFCILTGKIPPENRKKLFFEHQLLFYTPQTLRNDLVNEKYSLKDVCLVIFDEAHHASGDYPYKLIADDYIDQNIDGNILALTASPGSSKKKITQLCKTLHIPLKNTNFRTRKDSDVKQYLKPMDIFKIGVDLTELMEDSYSILRHLIEERLQYLSKLSFLNIKSDVLFKKVIRKDLLKLNSELVKILKNNGDKTGVYSAISVNAQALILYHMIELVEQQGLDSLLNYLEKLYKDSLKKNSSKAIKILASDYRLRRMYLELKKNQELSPDNLIHPKYKILEKIILEELYYNPNSLILVFVKFRVSIKNIVDKLKKDKTIKPVRFVGQATKSSNDKGLSQKQQIEILDKFKQGDYNVLVSTNVGEEGLDIAECDLVVFYDVVASEIRFIQRKGRTARHREGKVVILYTIGTNDEIYMKIALNKLRKMNVNLKSSADLRNSYKIDEKKDKLSTTEEKWNSNELKENIVKVARSKKKIKQSNLQAFINGKEFKQAIGILGNKTDIKLGNSLSMKFGIRKKLRENNINYQVLNSKCHIVILDKILVQIFDPKAFSKGEFVQIYRDLNSEREFTFAIFDFINFKEDFEGEKRLMKKNLQEFNKMDTLKVIAIDNVEELFFIVKNVYEYNKNKVK